MELGINWHLVDVYKIKTVNDFTGSGVGGPEGLILCVVVIFLLFF